jgi:hypothetical protein
VVVDLVHEEFDPYKVAMRDYLVGGCDSFLHYEPHNCIPSIPHNEVCILFTYLFNFRPSVSF